MRLGLIARNNHKGLGTMTHEFFCHMKPERTLVVRTAADESAHDFADARVVDFDGRSLDDAAIDWLLDGCDVLYTAETPYDYRVFERARERGVRTFLHGMWEFLRYRVEPKLPPPTMFLAPSSWQLGSWPTPVALLAVPVASERFSVSESESVQTIVHPGGSPARGDRNGTQALIDALPFVKSELRVVVRCMSPNELRPRRRHNRVELAVERALPRYEDVTASADAIVLPRRYGGLCLPLQEASARHLPVLALQREREAGYEHAAVVPVGRSRPMRLPCGIVDRADVSPRVLAAAIDTLASSSKQQQSLRALSSAWSAQHSWEALFPAYQRLLRSESV